MSRSYFSGGRASAILFRFTRIEVKSRTLTLQDKRQSDNPYPISSGLRVRLRQFSPKKSPPMQEMKLQDLKVKSPTELLSFAEEFAVENASALRKQELMFAILKQLAAREIEITGNGVVEILQDGFGFLRSPDSNYLPGPDDIYVSPSQIRRFGLRTGDTVEGQIRGPKEGERYFALLKVNKINFDDPEKIRHKVAFRQSDAALSEQVAEDGDGTAGIRRI